MTDDFNPKTQHEVQRQLGRCMLRLQQYERLMKAMLSLHRLAGPIDELEARQAALVSRFAGKSLGQLVEHLFDTYLVPEGTDPPELDTSKCSTDRIMTSISFQIEMDEERLTGVKATIEELVRMRNALVHHFIERFDIWTDEGCRAALEHLHSTYLRVDEHYVELVEWARGMDKARALHASFAQTPAFLDWMVNGISPDGTVDWQLAGIVRALREAADENSVDGWLPLETARTWIEQRHPEQKPERYSCKTWPQVVNESRAFLLEYRLEGGRKVAWIRALERR